MPIYAYKCSACGFEKDALQKMSDEPLTVCTQCGQATFSKQVTAAGFQLKGSGWYVTDFRDSGSGKQSKKTDKTESATSEGASQSTEADKTTKPAETKPAETKPGAGDVGSPSSSAS